MGMTKRIASSDVTVKMTLLTKACGYWVLEKRKMKLSKFNQDFGRAVGSLIISPLLLKAEIKEK
jgi:hypothetical protein